MDKFIEMDALTSYFIKSLKLRREILKLSLPELSKKLGISKSMLWFYEKEINLPKLTPLMKLANFYDYNLAGTLNYRVFYKEIDFNYVKSNLKRYGINASELSRIIPYSKSCILRTIKNQSGMSISCLKAILEIIKAEKEREKLRTNETKKMDKKAISSRKSSRNFVSRRI